MRLRNNVPCSQLLILCIKNPTAKFSLFICLSAFALAKQENYQYDQADSRRNQIFACRLSCRP